MTTYVPGLTSYTASEISRLFLFYKAGGTSDAYKVINATIKSADKALSATARPYMHIATSGDEVHSGSGSNTGDTAAQSAQAHALALSYAITGKSAYGTQAKQLLLGWAKTNIPDGDPIANASLLKVVQAYDLLRGTCTTSEKATVDSWLSGIADAIITGQAHAKAEHSMTAANNHQSWALLEVGSIGAALGNDTYMHYLTDNFLPHIGVNLASQPGEPAHLGMDYHQRDALHYVAYNLEALTEAAILVDRMGHLPGNPYGIHYNPFTAEANGASLAHTFNALLPYLTGEKQSTREYADSLNRNDALRIAKGDLSTTFDPSDALGVLEAADYFGHKIGGHTISQLTSDILKSDGKLSLPASLPDLDFLQNSVASPYYATPTLKIATDGKTHSIEAHGESENFQFYKNTGKTAIHGFSTDDTLFISSKMYATAQEAASHVKYAGGNATLALDGHNAVTLTGIAAHSLTAEDFHIFAG